MSSLLFIAPSDSGLNVIPELAVLYENGFYVQVAQGIVTRDRLFDVARRHEFDIVHIAAHTGADGILLSQGEYLDVPGIVQLVKLCRAHLVFINGCSSAKIGQVLVDEGIPAVIATLASIPDDTARETAQLFYKEFALSQDIHLAYRRSKPPIKGGYILLTDGQWAELTIAPIVKRLDEMAENWRTYMMRNDEEHVELRKMDYEITIDLGTLHENILTTVRLKRWFLTVLIFMLAMTTFIQLAFMLLRR